jgi:hypothetical protein
VRYITPEALLRMRFGEPPWPSWDIAVLCFRGDGGGAALIDKLGARPVGGKVRMRSRRRPSARSLTR